MRNNSKLRRKFKFLQLSESQKYHQATKLEKFLDKSNATNVGPKEWFQVFYKGYPKFEKIALPKKLKLNKSKFLITLKKRHSSRQYSNQPLNFAKLSTLLYYSAGIRNINRKTGNRFYPSAGARYPLEVYAINFNTKGLKQGIYHYHLKSDKLEFLWTKRNLKKEVLKNFNQNWISKAGILIIISAVFWRNEMKYGDRGYRHIWTEIGSLTQNIYLLSSALNIGCCSIGGYIDDRLNFLLDLDGYDESVLSVIAIGEFDK